MTRGPGDRRSRRSRLRRALAAEGGLTLLLALMLLYVFVVAPLVSSRLSLRFLLDIVFTFIVVAANTALARRRRLLVVTVLLAVVVLASSWARYLVHSTALVVLDELATIAFLAITLVGILSRTLASGRINFHRVNGSVACYLMLALLWTSAFTLVETLEPGSFDMDAHEATRHGTVGTMLYFSLVTLTTLGYGDITPVSGAARQLSMLEALTGQLFLVVLVARMVALWSQHSPRETDREE